ncbi:mechanosensitive ion channel family protein [Amycolatopsis keratiniphila]|uniref:mechanosensitive ion channel family protein n=1 Tax=Amycolatopsis keratiniphila TaxID=129921 RepID=UPI000907A6AE|nr:mechanosensitive ion channel family protein [Amycolatopsis keratiniphila]OLZ46648.1 mechanosensitive ion channel protein MscS [Amycolatopsis keratiniphila subsp. nogabecina]
MNLLPTEPPACTREAGSLCYQVFQVTKNEWLSASAGWLLTKPLRILMIVAVAFLLRYLVRRLINRVTRMPGGGSSKLPALLRPLRERAPEVLGSAVMERRRQRAATIGSVLKSMATFLIYGLAFILVLGELGIDLAPIIASAGIVGVALGFGAQNLVKDFLSGMFMMIEDQYGVGDVVDVGEASGTVEAVGLRITTLRDINGTVWYVRNGEVLRVGNSSQGFAVAVVDVPLSYSADVEKATELMAAKAKTLLESESLAPNVLEPPEMLGVETVTPEGIKLRLTVKVRPGKQWSVQRALRAHLLAALDEAGFEPPLGRFMSSGPAPQ